MLPRIHVLGESTVQDLKRLCILGPQFVEALLSKGMYPGVALVGVGW